jgi:hypothetical protein
VVDFLPFSRFILDIDFTTGVWGTAVHPTCQRGDSTVSPPVVGGCNSSFPVKVGDLSGVGAFLVNSFGSQRFQAFDPRVDAANQFTMRGKVVQNDVDVGRLPGDDSDVFRPGADFRLTVKRNAGNTSVVYVADGFPAAEAFQIKDGYKSNMFNSETLVKTAPSPLGMAVGETDIVSGPVWATGLFTGCAIGKVRTTQGCVALNYELSGTIR